MRTYAPNLRSTLSRDETATALTIKSKNDCLLFGFSIFRRYSYKSLSCLTKKKGTWSNSSELSETLSSLEFSKKSELAD